MAYHNLLFNFKLKLSSERRREMKEKVMTSEMHFINKFFDKCIIFLSTAVEIKNSFYQFKNKNIFGFYEKINSFLKNMWQNKIKILLKPTLGCCRAVYI